MTEDGYRRLKRFAAQSGLDEGEALSFLFENFDSVTHEENLPRLMRFLTRDGRAQALGESMNEWLMRQPG